MPLVDTSHGQFIGLKRGIKGVYVKALQQRLNSVMEARKPLVVDGDFGRGTEAALLDFQKRARLAETGEVDSDTDLCLLEVEMRFNGAPIQLPQPTVVDLGNHVGRNIMTYCARERKKGQTTSDKGHHCAHWVSHVLENPHSNCGPRSVSYYGNLARDWLAYDPDRPTNFFGRPRLIYCALKGGFTRQGGGMRIRYPKRHIGILLGKNIFHYENGKASEKVVRAPSDRSGDRATCFIDRYGRGQCEHWTSAFPPGMILNIRYTGQG